MSIQLVRHYQRELGKAKDLGVKNEMGLKRPFSNLLYALCQTKNLTLVEEISIKNERGETIRPDGIVKGVNRLDWGYWESKDEADDIEEEIKKKFAKGYPNDNIIFEDTNQAILYQNGQRVATAKMQDEGVNLYALLQQFVSFERPEYTLFRQALEDFKTDIPPIIKELRQLMDEEAKENTAFVKAKTTFLKICQDSINPDITPNDIREMLVQHILTQDIFNTIFDEIDFHKSNNIAAELENVLKTFFTKNIKRNFYPKIRNYYAVIKTVAARIEDVREKQTFLKVIYEDFYKAYNPKGADRLGIVYTPNEIVRFMIESTDHLLYDHFGKELLSEGVEILDPATGTGTFITDLIDYFPSSKKEQIQRKYANELHANEVSILPYYIANLNIEYAYQQKTGEYKEFENLVFVDTLDNMGFGFTGKQTGLFTSLSAENLDRIKRQNERKISVIIGNPPYNANQQNENDNNKNREYPDLDKRIKDTYIKESTAQKTKVYDMYSRFYRWAVDRLGEEGIIAFVTNRSFIDSRTFDGFRKCIYEDFDYVYIVDTKSDVRANPKIAGTTHNVFGIQTGVAIMFLIRKKN
jgi:predicted helicase